MKNMQPMAVLTILFVSLTGASAQSLGDYARAARKNKIEPPTASRHFDNDNLPTDEKLSVVGPAPSADPSVGQASGNAADANAKVAAASPSTADAQKSANDLKIKMDAQKEKIAALNHELDLDQREYRLRSAAMYGDAGNRLRNAAQWDKDDSQYKNTIEGKQKAVQAAQQELDDLQEQARKAGIAEKDKDDKK